MSDSARADIFVRNLPAIYQEQPSIAEFLRPFEAVLLGGQARLPEESPGLREIILALPDLLDPDKTPEEFLPWLASWLALDLRADLPVDRKRSLIANAVALYTWRGTRKGLEDMLNIITGGGSAAIKEPEILTLTVGVQAVVGSTTRLGRDLPYFFEVRLTMPHGPLTGEKLSALEALVRDTIELGKPAHTHYQLELAFANRTSEDHASVTERAKENASSIEQ